MKLLIQIRLFIHDTLPHGFVHAKHRFLGTPLPYATVAENDFGAKTTQELVDRLPAIDASIHPQDDKR